MTILLVRGYDCSFHLFCNNNLDFGGKSAKLSSSSISTSFTLLPYKNISNSCVNTNSLPLTVNLFGNS